MFDFSHNMIAIPINNHHENTTMPLKKITDVSNFFKLENNQWIFTGSKLEIFIPKMYEERGFLTIGEYATSLGIFQLRIDDTYETNFIILSKLVIEFISSRTVTENDYPYIVLSLEKGSIFIQNNLLIKDQNLVYPIFVTFFALGKIPPFIDYNNIHKLLDKIKPQCGVDLKLNGTIYEMIYAHIFRDAKDPYTFYRNTPMTEKPITVALHQISHALQSASARIIGSYFTEGVTAALVDETERVPSTIENLLRA